ncbi:hypothetical protein [Leptospira kirschneri]|uniref:hypothetical protein n=1 Tax=Leptospira kirschneri TaxID=29507 RepID=UPI0035618889
MENTMIRISNYDLDINEPIPLDRNEFFTAEFINFETSSLLKLIVKTLSEFSDKYNRDSGNIGEFINQITAKVLNDKQFEKLSKQSKFLTVITRENLLYLIKKILTLKYSGHQHKTKVFGIEEVGKIFLRINCLYMDVEFGGEKISDNLFPLLNSSFSSHLFLVNCKLNLGELLRNYNLMLRILETQIGKKANELFFERYCINFIDSIFLSYLFYSIFIEKYKLNDYSNVLSKSLIFNFLGKESVLLTDRIIKFLDRLSDRENVNFKKDESLFDIYQLWTWPIEKLDDDSYLILDLALIFDKSFRNPFIFLESEYLNNEAIKSNKKHLDLRSEILGNVFENETKYYFQKVISNDQNTPVLKNDEELCDYLVGDNDRLILIEIKAGYLPVKELYNDIRAEDLIELIAKKFGWMYDQNKTYTTSSGDKAKGVIQLCKAYKALDQGSVENKLDVKSWEMIKNAREIYSIVISQDLVFSAPFLNLGLVTQNLEFCKNMSSESRTYHPPIIINFDCLHLFIENPTKFVEAISGYLIQIREKELYLSFYDYVVTTYAEPVQVDILEWKKFVENFNNYVIEEK